MKPIKIDSQEYYLKSSFSELTREEILKVSYVRSQQLTDRDQSLEQYDAMRITLFTICSNVPFKITKNITSVQWVDILPHLDWCFQVPNFNGNPVFQFKHRFKTWIGPVEKLKNSTIEEMIAADNAFVAASNGKDPELLYILAAILWRPLRSDLAEFRRSREWNGDIREPFNIHRCKERVKYFKKMPAYFIAYCFLYYWDFRENHLMKFKRVFPKTQKKSTGTNRGWAGTLLEISHLPVFGSIDELKHQNWYTVLFEMERQLELAEIREEDAIRKKLNNR